MVLQLQQHKNVRKVKHTKGTKWETTPAGQSFLQPGGLAAGGPTARQPDGPAAEHRSVASRWRPDTSRKRSYTYLVRILPLGSGDPYFFKFNFLSSTYLHWSTEPRVTLSQKRKNNLSGATRRLDEATNRLGTRWALVADFSAYNGPPPPTVCVYIYIYTHINIYMYLS